MNLRKDRLAVLLGGLAGLLIFAYLNVVNARAQAAIDRALRSAGPRRLVVTAVRDLKVGERVSDKDVEMRSISAEALGPGAATRLRSVIGQTISQDINAREQILLSHLNRGFAGRASASLAPGKRAVAIAPADIASAPPGISAGDRVDVFGFHPDGVFGKVLKNVLVRGVGGRPPFVAIKRNTRRSVLEAGLEPEDTGEQELIVEVDAWEAAQLVSMGESGRVRIVLRASMVNQND